MKNLDKITERIIDVSSEQELAKSLFPVLGGKNLKYCYAVYSNNGKYSPIIGYLTNELEGVNVSFKNELKVFIEKYNPKSFNDFLFFVDIYSRFNSQPAIEDVCERKFKSNGMVEDILKDSRGLLIWHYQLENLIRLFYSDNEHVVRLRKDINAKKAEAWELAKKLSFSDELTLYDIISDRMAVDITRNPNIQGAYNLFTTINNGH